jgi:hypothetical protein
MPEAVKTADLQGFVPRCPRTSSNVRPRRIWDDLLGVRARRIACSGGLSGSPGRLRTSSARLSAWSVCLWLWRYPERWALCRQRRLGLRGGFGASRQRWGTGWPRSHARELHRAGCEITAAQSASVNLAFCVHTAVSARDAQPGHGRPARPPCATASARAARSLGSLRCRL